MKNRVERPYTPPPPPLPTTAAQHTVRIGEGQSQQKSKHTLTKSTLKCEFWIQNFDEEEKEKTVPIDSSS